MSVDKKKKISAENAKIEIDKIIEFYEIEGASEDNVIKGIVAKLMTAVSKARLEVEVSGDGISITQHLAKPIGALEKLVYGELTGGSKRAMARIKDDSDVFGKIYALLGSMAKEDAAIFEKMRAPDITTAEQLGMLFLQV